GGRLAACLRLPLEVARGGPANTGEVLLSLMERRLDNVVHRLGFAPSRRAARQVVGHGHISVNGHYVNIPSYICRAGDVITVKNRKPSRELVKLSLTDGSPK